MSYEVTATRRRPQQFTDLVGQEFVAQTLINSIKSGKIAHAYLFAGPRGCGKTSTARILAKALNCQDGPTDSPCGNCSNCQEITKGTSLDVIEIDGASNTSVENIRQIKDEVLFPPGNSKYKIYIIDEVHMLSTSAFNALLKTIEEPPPYVIFIFATTELQKVPATIKSRCQQFNFRLVSIEKVKQCLAQAASEINVQADDEALFWIARESTGSMRDAYTLFDQVVAFSDGHITYEKIRDKLGLVGIDRLNTIFEACVNNKPDEVISLLDDFLQGGVSIEQLISNCADYLRSLLLIKSGVKKESLLGNSVERYSGIVIGAWNAIQVERALSIFLQLYRDIRYSLSPRYELELTFSRLCWLSQYVSNAEVKKAIDAAQVLLGGVNPKAVQTKEVSEAETSGMSEKAFPNVTKVPEGLPILTINDTPSEYSQASEGTENSSEAAGEQNPFHNGGPLPPEQSVESGAAQISVPLSSTGYSFNPDESENEAWSNMDAPPDDYYPDEGDYAQQAEQTYEQSIAPEESAAPVQLDETFTKPDGSTISIAQLRGSVMAALSITDGFAASNLEKTGIWHVTDEGVNTEVINQYDLELIKKKQQIICAEVSKVCGKEMQFNVTLCIPKADAEKANVEIPSQVQMLVNTFKGSIVAGKQ